MTGAFVAEHAGLVAAPILALVGFFAFVAFQAYRARR
jgi:hypothetical protein